MIRICLCFAIALFAVPAPAVAEDLERSEFFDEYDQDSDGCVTKDEFTGSSEMFKLLDKDGDGVIKPTDLGLPADYKPDPKRKRRPGGEAGARGGDMDKRRQQFMKALQKMDTDQDGRISKAEWKGKEQGFARMDRNKDGFLDAKDRAGMDRGGRNKGQGQKGRSLTDEKKAEIRTKAAEQFAKLDGNADGKITADEVPSPMMLELADADGDGNVTLKEFQKVLLQRATRRAQGGGRDGRRGGGRGGRGLNAGRLKSWDRDGDGKVSAEEFPGREAMFARLDADKDGFLTQADIKAQKGARKKKDSGPVTKKTGTVIERMDADGDGRLHRAEFTGSAADWANLDRNRDGWITQDELVAKPQ